MRDGLFGDIIPQETPKNSPEGYHIIEMEQINNKKIRLFSLNPDGKHVEIAGTTGQGKTTAASILWDLIGIDNSNQKDNITHNEKEAFKRVKLAYPDGDKILNIRRKFWFEKKSGTETSKLTITDENGRTLKVADVKEMFSQLTSNPHKIMTMEPKEQVKILLESADLGGFDVEKADEEIDELAEKRLEAKRKVNFIGDPGDGPEKVERVSSISLLEELEQAQQNNGDIEDLEADIDRLEEEINGAASRIEELEEEIAKLKDQQESDRLDLASQKSKLSFKTIIPEEPIRKELSEIDETNAKADKYDLWVERNTSYNTALEEHKAAEEAVKSAVAKRNKVLNDAKFPLPELSYEDGNVLYKGMLLKNLGESERILVGCALLVKSIKEIRCVLIDGAESISKSDFQKIHKLFSENNIQAISTRVSRGDIEPQEIEIVDGVYDGDEE